MKRKTRAARHEQITVWFLHLRIPTLYDMALFTITYALTASWLRQKGCSDRRVRFGSNQAQKEKPHVLLCVSVSSAQFQGLLQASSHKDTVLAHVTGKSRKSSGSGPV